MISKLKSLNSSIYMKQRLIVTAFIVFIVAALSVGYALYYEELKAVGDLVVMSPDEFVIYNIEVFEASEVSNSGFCYNTEQGTDSSVILDSDLSFELDSEIVADNMPYIVYKYQIANFTNNSYTYSDFNHESSLSDVILPVVTGMNIGDVLESGSIIDVYVKYYIDCSSSFSETITVSANFIFNEGIVSINSGSLQTTIDTNSLILNANNMSSTNAYILNLYKTSVEYELVSTNADVLLVDSNGNDYTYSGVISEADTDEHLIYFKVQDGVDLTDGIVTELLAVTHENSEYSFGDVTLSPELTSKWQLTLDNDSDGYPDVGDVITIDSESFFVYDNDGTTVKAIAKYNLYVGGTYDENKWIYTEYGSEATGLQDSTMIGYNATSSSVNIRYGTVNFGSNTSYDSSTIKNYVENYATVLDSLDANVSDVTLITKAELESLGCSSSSMSCKNAPAFISTSSYWTKSITTSGYVWLVNTDSYYWEVEQWHSRSLGVRPVITITLENLGLN